MKLTPLFFAPDDKISRRFFARKEGPEGAKSAVPIFFEKHWVQKSGPKTLIFQRFQAKKFCTH